MREVEEFINGQNGPQKELLVYLHHLMVDQYQLIPKIRFKIPFYYKNSWVIYLNPLKNGSIDLSVVRAIEQNQVNELLDFKSRKQVASIELNPNTDLPEKAIRKIIEDAILLDANPQNTKGVKSKPKQNS